VTRGGAPARGFWLRQAPVDSLCLYRAGFCLLLLADAASWLPHAEELFSSEGFHLGLLAPLAPPPALATFLCAALAASALLAAVGLWTRASLAVTAVLWSFLYAIDQINEKAITSIAILVLAILLASPSAARYSLDDWLARRRGLERRPGTASIFPLRLLQLEFAQVYFFAGLVKLFVPGWRDGTIPLRSLRSQWATDLGVWISGWAPEILIRAGGWGTILFELTAPFCLFIPRARAAWIAAGVLFHAAIAATLSVGSLSPHFILALLLLFPAPETFSRARATRS
jgi:hypothetical protein